jgi:hypothetical protein
MEIEIGSLNVLFSGTVLAEIGKPIKIDFGDADNLKLIFNLIVDPSKGKFNSDVRLYNERTIELDLINFVLPKETTGGGSMHPVKIGTFKNRALYYAFIVTSVGSGVLPLFHYTFYLGEEVKNG